MLLNIGLIRGIKNRFKRRRYEVDDVPAEVGPKVVQSEYTAKSVGKNLVKAIFKPTVSHIADACNELEVSDNHPALASFISMSNRSAITRTQARDTDITSRSKSKERSKKGLAVGIVRNAGFVSAVFLGKVAVLPFKSE